MIENTNFDEINSESIPVSTVAMFVGLAVLISLALLMSDKQKTGLPVKGNSAVSFDWNEGNTYNRKEI